jgi:hypothetical protein
MKRGLYAGNYKMIGFGVVFLKYDPETSYPPRNPTP